MEANEVHELQEMQESEENHGLKHVSFTMSVLAVLLAMTTVLGHRTHTEAVLIQSRVSDQWNFYQAKKIRATNAKNFGDLINTVQAKDATAAAALSASLQAYAKKEGGDLDVQKDRATEMEDEVKVEERKAGRFDLGEALLQIGVIVVSITLLTRRIVYWYLGMFFGLAGIVAAALGFLVH